VSDKRISILIVDDEALNILILEEYLTDHYKLTSAPGGVQALKSLESYPNSFDIILLDWLMPSIDGIEVLKRIRAHSKLRQIQVIMQSSNGMKDKIKLAMESGADYYITKPYTEQEINKLIETVARKLSSQTV